MNGDLFLIAKWWLILFALGALNFPLVFSIFKKLADRGYAFSKTLALAFTSYFVFLVSVTHLSTFSNGLIYFGIFLLTLANLYFLFKDKKGIKDFIFKNAKLLFLEELLFTIGLIFWSIVRGYQPDIEGLEKFMDYGFLNSLLRSRYLPPTDMWLAGSYINYYWFGHLVTAILTKISDIPSKFTYNLMLATILGFLMEGAFSISVSLLTNLNVKINKKLIIFAGILTALVISFGGNFHTLVYTIKNGADKYWYPDATRFIGYNPDTNDKTIHEFPAYSFVVSDLHAHVLSIPFVLLFVAILWNFIYDKEKRSLDILLGGFILGILFMTNTWDFANYMLLAGFSVLLFNIRKYFFKPIDIVTQSVGILFLLVTFGLLFALPFILNFVSIAQGIKFVHSHSPIWQLAILWGFPAILTITFVIFLVRAKERVRDSDLFVLTLLITTWTLIAMPEIIYVKDIYIDSYYRANTMFKLTYSAFIMSYITSGYVMVRVGNTIKNTINRFSFFLFFMVSIASLLYYSKFSISSFYAELKIYKGLDGESWLLQKYPSEQNVISWFRKNVSGQPVILEAPGDSYTDFDMISSYTGLPTVSGWFVHEWLWRGGTEIPQQRVNDISQIYISSDINLTRSLLSKYKVSYVVIGNFERQKFPNLNESKFGSIGKLVYATGIIDVYQINN